MMATETNGANGATTRNEEGGAPRADRDMTETDPGVTQPHPRPRPTKKGGGPCEAPPGMEREGKIARKGAPQAL